MDTALKDLAKLEQLTTCPSTPSSKLKSVGIRESIDSLLDSLRQTKAQLESGGDSRESVNILPKIIEARKRDIEQRQKDIHNTVAKIGKILDKQIAHPPPKYDPLFRSPESVSALERAIALHYLRTGHFEIARTLVEVADVDVRREESQLNDLYQTLVALQNGNVDPALEWAVANRDFLHARASPLEFKLHQSKYLRILLSSPSFQPALDYARAHFPSFWNAHQNSIDELMGCIVYLPLERLRTSPLAVYASDHIHLELASVFTTEWCARSGMSKQAPLKVVADIGGGGALARIEKGNKIMKERKSGWSQTEELPIEIQLPPENHYHSIFVCPVSKEQASDKNPPMMLQCGHVISKESLEKLQRPQGRIKCPYCPVESVSNSVIRVYL